jgi:hypothetical protein
VAVVVWSHIQFSTTRKAQQNTRSVAFRWIAALRTEAVKTGKQYPPLKRNVAFPCSFRSCSVRFFMDSHSSCV